MATEGMSEAPERGRRSDDGLALTLACLIGTVAVFIVSLFGHPILGLPILIAPVVVLVIRATKRDVTTVLSVYVALLIFVPSVLIVGPLGASGTPANILGILMGWWWFQRYAVGSGGMKARPSPVRYAVFAFALALLGSYATFAFRPIYPKEVSAADRGVLFFLGCAGVVLLATDGLATRERIDVLLRRLVGATAVLASFGVYQFFTGFDINNTIHIPGLTQNQQLSDVIERSIFRRVAGTASHPIEFGVVLAVVFPIALHYALYSPPASRRRWFVAVGLIALGIPMSLSRSAVVSLVVAMLMLLAVWSRKRRTRAVQISLLFGVVTRFAIPGLLGTVKSLFINIANDPSTTGRTQDYGTIAGYIGDHYVFGRGFFTFLPDIYTTLDNAYLLILIEMGVVGLAVLIALFITGMCAGRAARHAATDEATRHLGQALAASVAASMVAFGTFDGLSFPMASGTLFLLIGVAGGLRRVTREEASRAARSSGALDGGAAGRETVIGPEIHGS